MTTSHADPVVGVVVPTYNMEQKLRQTLQSIINQTFSNWTCCIVNDGSTDGSGAIACHFARLDSRFYVLNQINQGISAARNNGMRALPGSVEYVAFLDADDIWKNDTLEVLFGALHGTEFIGAHGLGETIDCDNPALDKATFTEYGRSRLGIENGRFVPWPSDRATNFAAVAIHSKVFPPGLILVRRDALIRVGNWDPKFPILQDWDMLIRLTRLGDFRFVDQVVIEYVRSSTSMSASRKNNLIDVRNIYFKTFNSAENSPEQKAILRDGWRAVQLMKMREKSRTIQDSLKRANLRTACTTAAALPLNVIRYVRGYPTRRWL